MLADLLFRRTTVFVLVAVFAGCLLHAATAGNTVPATYAGQSAPASTTAAQLNANLSTKCGASTYSASPSYILVGSQTSSTMNTMILGRGLTSDNFSSHPGNNNCCVEPTSVYSQLNGSQTQGCTHVAP